MLLVVILNFSNFWVDRLQIEQSIEITFLTNFPEVFHIELVNFE